MHALAASSASAWYLTLKLIATFIKPLANWEYEQAVHDQDIAPQHRTNRVPQGSPSYVGGQRPEVPLYLCCTPPGWAISTQAYRLRIARTSIASGHGGKQKTALAQ